LSITPFLHLLAQAGGTTQEGPALAPAPGTPTAPSAVPQPWWIENKMLIPLIAIMAFFFYSTWRRNKVAEKEKREMLNSMKKGDRVLTTSGMLGTIVEARDNEVVLKVDESSNTKIRFTRSAVLRVIKEDEAAK